MGTASDLDSGALGWLESQLDHWAVVHTQAHPWVAFHFPTVIWNHFGSQVRGSCFPRALHCELYGDVLMVTAGGWWPLERWRQ